MVKPVTPPEGIRIAVAIDEVGLSFQDPAREMEEIRETLVTILARPVVIIDRATSSRDLSGLLGRDPEVDILVVDYGGLTAAYDPSQNVRGEDMARKVSHWAGEHPGKLLLIWTQMAGYGRDEIGKVFADLDNYLAYDNGFGPGSFEAKLQARFGEGDPAWLSQELGVSSLKAPKEFL